MASTKKPKASSWKANKLAPSMTLTIESHCSAQLVIDFGGPGADTRAIALYRAIRAASKAKGAA